MNTLIKIDDDSTYHLYSWSHFAFVFYITDNNGKIVSTITFIILNGNDNIAPPSTEETKQKVPNTKEEVPVTTRPSQRKVPAFPDRTGTDSRRWLPDSFCPLRSR